MASSPGPEGHLPLKPMQRIASALHSHTKIGPKWASRNRKESDCREQLGSGKFKFVRAHASFLDPHTVALSNAGAFTAVHFVITAGSTVAPSPPKKSCSPSVACRTPRRLTSPKPASPLTVHALAALPHYHPTLAEIWTYPAEALAERIPALR